MIPLFTIHITNNALVGIAIICTTLSWIAWSNHRRASEKQVEK